MRHKPSRYRAPSQPIHAPTRLHAHRDTYITATETEPPYYPLDSLSYSVYHTYTLSHPKDTPMARVQLIIPDEDRDRFAHQARAEGLTFSAWLRAAARQRFAQRQRAQRFDSPKDLHRFLDECAARRGPGAEPDWEEHKRAMSESRLRGLPSV